MNEPTAEITAAIILLEENGYRVVPPFVEAASPPPEVDMDQVVAEARAKVERLRTAEEDADARCMSTALNDRDLPRFREESIHFGHQLAQAEEDLKNALADRDLFKRSDEPQPKQA